MESQAGSPETQETSCDKNPVCKDFKDFIKERLTNPEGPISQYNLNSVMVTSSAQLFGRLSNPSPLQYQAGTINMFLTFYQDGIMQCNFQVDGEAYRFGISSTGVGVEWANLKKVTDLSKRMTYLANGVQLSFTSEDGLDKIDYVLQYKPFRILQYVNDIMTIVGNDKDTLQYAAPDAPHSTYYLEND